MTSSPAIDEAWLTAALGWRPQRATSTGCRCGTSWVVRLEGPGRHLAYLKVHADMRKHRQEHAAYRRWAALLPGTPALLASRATPRPTLVLSAVPGRVVTTSPDRPADLATAHRAAGAWLRALHTLPHVDDDAVPMATALERRARAWGVRATGAVPSATRVWVAERLLRLDLVGLRRAPCHRDFTPRNWLWHEDHGLGVIDFEHARADLNWADVVRLIDGAWVERPDLQEAFWDGYGRIPNDGEAELLVALRALHALGTVAWAVAHGDHALEAIGRSALRRLGAPVA